MPQHKPNYSSSSSDDEEEEQVSGSESDTDSNPKPKPKLKPEPKKTLNKVTAPPQSANKPPDLSSQSDQSDSENDSDSDSDSDLPPKLAVNPKPNASGLSVSETEDSGSETDNDNTDTVSQPKKADKNLKNVKNLKLKSVDKTGAKTVVTPPRANNKRPLDAHAVAKKQPKKLKLNKVEKLKARIGSETDESGSDTDSQPEKTAASDINANSKSMSSKQVVSKLKLGEKIGGKMVSTPTKSKAVADEETKKQLFQRLWSEDDEIAILEGMIGYTNENGKNAMTDMGAFYEFIKEKLHVEVSRTQFLDKVRKLKKKYANNVSREMKDGKVISFSKSHEQKVYELSKLIWGGNGNVGTESKKKTKSQKNGKLKGTVGVDDKEKVMMEGEKNMDISRLVRYGGMSGSSIVSEEIVKMGLELAEGSKRAELEEKWRKLNERELEIYLKRMELLREQALVVLEAVRSSGN